MGVDDEARDTQQVVDAARRFVEACDSFAALPYPERLKVVADALAATYCCALSWADRRQFDSLPWSAAAGTDVLTADSERRRRYARALARIFR